MNKEEKAQKKAEIKAAKSKEKVRQRLREKIYQDMVSKQKISLRQHKLAPKNVCIAIEHVNKIYNNRVQAVFDFNLKIKKGEFIVLVGPSGCGKSTTLRMIAGLEEITGGDLFIDGVHANLLEPKDRGIAMVFQSYALYPNMSVRGNMAFSLRIRKVPRLQLDKNGQPIKRINYGLIRDNKRELKNLEWVLSKAKDPLEIEGYKKDIESIKEKIAYLEATPVDYYKKVHISADEINKRVNDAATILQIEDYMDRKPKALSGGQCQRVALGRAIVRKAKVFLMDEPLSNLDAKLRVQMRSEIVKLHNNLKATTIYVTHDQTEAMTMATRIVVMNKGYVQQVGTPSEIYNHPANLFVATFIGSPSMNCFEGSYKKGSFAFESGKSIKLPSDLTKEIEDFYKNGIVLSKKGIEDIDADFPDRSQLLKRLENLEALGKNEPEYEAKKTELIEKIAFVEASHHERKKFVTYIAAFEKALKEGVYPVTFGIRPEDIYDGNEIAKGTKGFTEPIELTVSVSELMGYEYFVHSDFEGKDMVAKFDAKSVIAAGMKIKEVFDLNRFHLFDTLSKKLIH